MTDDQENQSFDILGEDTNERDGNEDYVDPGPNVVMTGGPTHAETNRDAFPGLAQPIINDPDDGLPRPDDMGKMFSAPALTPASFVCLSRQVEVEGVGLSGKKQLTILPPCKHHFTQMVSDSAVEHEGKPITETKSWCMAQRTVGGAFFCTNNSAIYECSLRDPPLPGTSSDLVTTAGPMTTAWYRKKIKQGEERVYLKMVADAPFTTDWSALAESYWFESWNRDWTGTQLIDPTTYDPAGGYFVVEPPSNSPIEADIVVLTNADWQPPDQYFLANGFPTSTQMLLRIKTPPAGEVANKEAEFAFRDDWLLRAGLDRNPKLCAEAIRAGRGVQIMGGEQDTLLFAVLVMAELLGVRPMEAYTRAPGVMASAYLAYMGSRS